LRHTSAGDYTAARDSNQPSSTFSRRFTPEEKFCLRLHWQRGYIWQESPKEAWYCAACAVCDPDNIFGGLKNYTIKSHCREGMSLAITGCDPPKRNEGKSQNEGNGQPIGSKIAIFTRLKKTSRGLFDADNLDGNQIQVHNNNLCLQKVGKRDVLLKRCNALSTQQRFLGFRSGGQTMELVPLTDRKRCLTQHHEPRPNEKIYAEECFKARRSETSFWTSF
jgi:hypothetical protein